jgi:hypothetical protein
MTQILDPDMQDDWNEMEKDNEALLRVARALQDIKNYFANSTVSSADVFHEPYFRDGIRHAYTVLKEVEHLL